MSRFTLSNSYYTLPLKYVVTEQVDIFLTSMSPKLENLQMFKRIETKK